MKLGTSVQSLLLAWAAFAAAALAGEAKAPQDEGPALFPVQVSGYWGYIDRDGNIVVEPQFLRARELSEGLAGVYTGRFGYIDVAGKLAIAAQFGSTFDFSDGFAWVRIGDAYGVIDKSGQVVVQPTYRNAGSAFSDGASVVSMKDPKSYLMRVRNETHTVHPQRDGIIDSKGSYLLKPTHELRISGPFSEGLAAAQASYVTRGKWVRSIGMRLGYMNRRGRFVIPQNFHRAENFSEGLAAVYNGTKWGYIDKRGRYAVRPQFDGAGPFSDGLAAVNFGRKRKGNRTTETGSWGYIDKRGRFVVRPRPLYDARPFSGGLATIVLKEERLPDRRLSTDCAVIDRKGRIVFQCEDGMVHPFRNGLARVVLGGKKGRTGYIDARGKYVWEPRR